MSANQITLAALGIACSVFALEGGPNDTGQSKTEPALTLVPETHPLLRELEPDRSHFVLKASGRDVALITVEQGQVVEMLLFNQGFTRQLSFDGDVQAFPTSISISLHPVAEPYSPTTTIIDDNLDGIPDKRMDWVNKQLYELSRIEWKPATPKTRPATTTKPG